MENNLKSPEEYIKPHRKFGSSNQDFWYCDPFKIEEVIKQVQIDAYNQALEDAANVVRIKGIEIISPHDPRPIYKQIIDRDLIFNLRKK
jgi:hypothetical protein